jgi:hypothetical protein
VQPNGTPRTGAGLCGPLETRCRGGFPDRWGHWVDAATDQIPLYYGMLHYGMVDIYAQADDLERAHWHSERAEAFMRLGEQRYRR